MKTLALRSTAAAVAALAIAAVSSPLSAQTATQQRSGYMVSWNKTTPAPAPAPAAGATERSGYMVCWN